MEIVIGYQGQEHITASQLGRIIAGMAGDGAYVLDTQEKLAATLQTANQVRIATGDLVFQGRVATVEVPETLTITNGATGQKRNDLIVARYSKEASSGKESCVLAVVKGTAVSYGDPADPSYASGSILDGDSPVEVPLYRIPIDGLTPGTPVKLIETVPSIDSLRDSVSRATVEITGCVADRAGALLVLNVTNVTLSAGAMRRLGTLPEGFRPSRLVIGVIDYRGSSGYVQVSPGGEVAAFSVAQGDFSGQVSYIVAP